MQFAGEFIVQGLPVAVMWSIACRPITLWDLFLCACVWVCCLLFFMSLSNVLMN